MATYDLEEQEQLDELKTWWKMYGNIVTGILLVAMLAVSGWQAWNWWQRSQAAEASALFSALQQSAAKQDAKRVRELAGELIDKYPRTAYAGMGALLSARVQVDANDRKNARAQLTWAVDNAQDPGLRDLSRLRLAAVLLDENEHEPALKLLATEPAASFAPRFAELRGDILAAQGKTVEARGAYEAALSKIIGKDEEAGARAAYRDVLQAKRDALGAGK